MEIPQKHQIYNYFGVGAYILLVSISGPCKILERPPHITNQVL